MSITREKAIRELDEIRDTPEAPIGDKKPPEKKPETPKDEKENGNNVPDPEGPHAPMYS